MTRQQRIKELQLLVKLHIALGQAANAYSNLFNLVKSENGIDHVAHYYQRQCETYKATELILGVDIDKRWALLAEMPMNEAR